MLEAGARCRRRRITYEGSFSPSSPGAERAWAKRGLGAAQERAAHHLDVIAKGTLEAFALII